MTRTKPYRRPVDKDEAPEGPIRSNLGLVALTNLKLIAFFIPVSAALGLYLAVGGLIFLVLAAALFVPAGPAITAALDTGFQLKRGITRYARRTFLQSYRSNLRQGSAIAAMLSPFAALLILTATMTERPAAVTLCLLLGTFLVVAAGLMAFSQAALVELPLGAVVKNSLLLIPAAGARGLIAAATDCAAIYLLLRYPVSALPAAILGGGGLLLIWNAVLLSDSLTKALISGE